jgi:hypothetical protein
MLPESIYKEFKRRADNLIVMKEEYKLHCSIETQRIKNAEIRMLEWAVLNLKNIIEG